MTYSKLFEQFEKDIIFDCHSLRARVSRSDARRQMTAIGPGIFPELYLHLKNYQSQAKIDEEVCHGWGILLSWFCEEHSLDRKEIAQDDFNSWVLWLQAS